jgi:alkylated DNA repair dioxygenase AlkB
MYGSWQASLFGGAPIAVDAEFRTLQRVVLDDDSWIDHRAGWLSGADDVFSELVAALPWGQRDVVMFERKLAEPRLTWWWEAASGEPEPLPILAEMRRVLARHYRVDLDSIGANWYRDGHDSVAWHGDRERRLPQPLVAIVSVGAPRPFLVRRRGGGPSSRFVLGHGALLVMGGRCQHDWEHCVPKVARAGPRISITFRHHS